MENNEKAQNDETRLAFLAAVPRRRCALTRVRADSRAPIRHSATAATAASPTKAKHVNIVMTKINIARNVRVYG